MALPAYTPYGYPAQTGMTNIGGAASIPIDRSQPIPGQEVGGNFQMGAVDPMFVYSPQAIAGTIGGSPSTAGMGAPIAGQQVGGNFQMGPTDPMFVYNPFAPITLPSPTPAPNIAPATPPAPTTMPQLPALRTATGKAAEGSTVDPNILPYLQMGLQRAEQLFFQNQPSMYPGQTYVSPSEQTLGALARQEQIATGGQPTLQAAQQSYLQSLGALGQTTSGSFLQGNPYQQQMMAAATRPLTQQFEQQVLPGISSLYSRAGRYGSGGMERALGTAAEGYGRALGDVTAGIAYKDYEAERNRQLEAAKVQAALAEAAPSFYSAQFLPSQTLGQVGAAREAIAAQPLQEAMQRYAFQQQLPYLQLESFLSGVYGNPLSRFQQLQPQQTNQFAQAVGGALAGSAIGGKTGAAIGGLAGLLF